MSIPYGENQVGGLYHTIATQIFCTFRFLLCVLAFWPLREPQAILILMLLAQFGGILSREESQAKEMSLPKDDSSERAAQWRPQMMSNKALIFLPYSPIFRFQI